MPNEKEYIRPNGDKYMVQSGSESDFLKQFPDAKPSADGGSKSKGSVFDAVPKLNQSSGNVYVRPNGDEYNVNVGSESDFLKQFPDAVLKGEKKKESPLQSSSSQSAFSGGGSLFGQRVPLKTTDSGITPDMNNIGSAFANIRKDLDSNDLQKFEMNIASDAKFASDATRTVNQQKLSEQTLSDIDRIKPQVPIQTQQELDKTARDARILMDNERIEDLNVINKYAPEFIENNKGIYDIISDIHGEPSTIQGSFFFNPSESVRNPQTENVRTGELSWSELKGIIGNVGINGNSPLNNRYSNLITNYLWSLFKTNPDLANDKLSLLLYTGDNSSDKLFNLSNEAYGYFGNVANKALDVLNKYGLTDANADLENVYSKYPEVSELLLRYDEGTLDQRGQERLLTMMKEVNMDLPTFRDRIKAESSALSIVNPLINVLQEQKNNITTIRKDKTFQPTLDKIHKTEEEKAIYENFGVNRNTFYGDELYDIAKRKAAGEDVSIPTDKLIINQVGTGINQLGQTVVGGGIGVFESTQDLLEKGFFGKNMITNADEWYGDARKFVENFVPVPQSEFVKDGKVNWTTGVSNITGTIADMAMMIYGGGAATKVAKGIGANQKTALLLGNLASGYLMTYDDHYKQAMATGQLTQNEASNYASVLAVLEGLIEATGTPSAMKKAAFGEKILSDVINEGVDLSTTNGLFSKLVNVAGKYAKESGLETAEEFEMMIAEKVGNAIVNKVADPSGLLGKFDENLDSDEMLATVILTPIATLGASAGSINTPLGSKMYSDAVFNSAVNPTWMNNVNKLIEKGDIKEETAKKFLADVELMKQSVSETTNMIVKNNNEKIVTSFIEKNGRQPSESEINDIVTLSQTVLNSNSKSVDEFIKKQSKLVENGELDASVAGAVADKLIANKELINNFVNGVSPTVLTNASQKVFSAAKKKLNKNKTYESAVGSLVADDLKSAEAIINSNDGIKKVDDISNTIYEKKVAGEDVSADIDMLSNAKADVNSAIGKQMIIDFDGESTPSVSQQTEISPEVGMETETTKSETDGLQNEKEQGQEQLVAEGSGVVGETTTTPTLTDAEIKPETDSISNVNQQESVIDDPTPETPISNGIVINRASALKFGAKLKPIIKGIRNISKKAFTNKYAMDKAMYDRIIQRSADTAALKHRTDVAWKSFRKAAEKHFGEKYEYLKPEQVIYLQNIIGNAIPDEVSSEYDNLVSVAEDIYGKKFNDFSDIEFNSFISDLYNLDNIQDDKLRDAAAAFVSSIEGYVGKLNTKEQVKSFVNQQQIQPKPLSDFTQVEKDLMRSLFDSRIVRRDMPNGDLKDAAINLRNTIDNLSDRLINSGALSSELSAKLEGNKGIYIARTYRIFGDENFGKRQLDILDDIIKLEDKLSPYLDDKGKLKPISNQPTNGVPLASRDFINSAEANNAKRIEDNLTELYQKDRNEMSRFNNISRAIDYAEDEVIRIANDRVNQFVDDDGNLKPLTPEQQEVYDANKELTERGDATRKAAYARIKNLIDDYTSKPSVNPQSTAGNKPNEASLKALGSIPYEYRSIMGQYLDPHINYINTMDRMIQLSTAYDTLNQIKDIGLKNGMFGKFKSADAAAAAGFPKQVIDAPTREVETVDDDGNIESSIERIFFDPKNGRAGNIFKNIYTTEETHDAIKEYLGDSASNVSKVMNVVKTINAFAKYNATVLNFQTMMVNFLSNISGSLINGNLPIYGAKAAKAIINNETLSQINVSEVEKLKKFRVLGESVNATDISTIVEKAKNVIDYFSRTDNGADFKSREDSINMLKSIGIDSKEAAKVYDSLKDNIPKLAKFVASKMWNDMYKWGDEFWKLNNYYGFLAKEKYYAGYNRDLKSNPFTDAEISEMEKTAAKKTYLLTPSASNALPITEVVRNVPFFGAFPTFAEQSVRTYARGIVDSVDLIKSGNPRKVAHGTAKLFTTMAMSAFFIGASDLIFAGGDDEEAKKIDALKSLMPSYMKYRTVIPIGRSDSDQLEYEYFDAERYWMPTAATSFIRSIFENMSSGNDLETTVSESISKFFSPFTGRELLFGKVLDLIKNEDPLTGRPIYNEAMTSFWDKDKWGYISDAFKPGTYRAVNKIVNRYSEGKDITNDVIGMASGGRIMRVVPELSLKGKIRNFLDKKSDYNRYIMPDFSTLKKMNSEDLSSAINNLEAEIRLQMAELKGTYDAVIVLGMNPSDADEIVKAKGMDKSLSKYIVTGDDKYIDEFMSKQRDKAYKKDVAADEGDYDWNKSKKMSNKRKRPTRPSNRRNRR